MGVRGSFEWLGGHLPSANVSIQLIIFVKFNKTTVKQPSTKKIEIDNNHRDV